MADIIQIRRDTAANWTAENPVLADGEIGLERGNEYWKVGDGVTAWNSLPYVGVGPQGPQGDTGVAGPEGDSAYEVAGANGFTGTETEWLISLGGIPGPGVPTGGTAKQILRKVSGTDYDSEWSDELDGVTVKEYTETINAAAGATLDRSTGGIQRLAMAANTTLDLTDLTAGQSVMYRVTGGTTYTLSYTGLGAWSNGTTPTLSATHYLEFVHDGVEVVGFDCGGR